jgi:hypothetical protein
MDIIEEFVLPMLAVMAFIITIIVALFGLGLWFDSISCHAQADRMGVPSTFNFTESCMIQVDGQWIPGSSYRYIGNLED